MEKDKFLPEYREDYLPSRGIQYPQGTRVYYSPYCLGELLNLDQHSQDEIDLLNFILDGVKVDGMDKYDLTYYDVAYLGWRRKTATLGASVVDAYSFCPNCDTKNSQSIDLTKLDFIDTDVQKTPIVLTISNVKLKLNFITVRDFLSLLSEKTTDFYHILAKSVTNLPYEEAYDIFMGASGTDLDKIYLLDTILYHGIKPIQFKCSHEECNHEYELDVTDSQEVEILKPFRTKEQIIRDEISFGE